MPVRRGPENHAMKVSNSLWRTRLEGKLPSQLQQEVDAFETEIQLRRQGKMDEKVFAETRLRRGVYGQRYDNGQRYDGMQGIKIPYGGLNPEQLEVMAELAEEYSDGIAHITTRQDFQLHFVHLEDTPALSRRLAAARITTPEACGTSVRNVT